MAEEKPKRECTDMIKVNADVHLKFKNGAEVTLDLAEARVLRDALNGMLGGPKFLPINWPHVTPQEWHPPGTTWCGDIATSTAGTSIDDQIRRAVDEAVAAGMENWTMGRGS